ncbi:MAG: ATP-binding protein [Frankiaceae bacterium]
MAGADELTTRDLDYLQRTDSPPPAVDLGAPATVALPRLRRLLRVTAIGRLVKEPVTAAPFRLLSADLLTALYNYQVPVAFHVGGEPGRVGVRIGTWLDEHGSEETLAGNEEVLRAALAALYPSVTTTAEDASLPRWPLGGMVLGVPTAKAPEAVDGALPMDRLFRALGGTGWSALVLAQPVDESFTLDVRLRVINEMRSAETASKTSGVPSPLAEHYVELLKSALDELAQGQATGAWRTAVYLLGDGDSYYQLASVWRGVFAGERSKPEPMRVWDRAEAPELATRWAMPYPVQNDGAPGRYRRPFSHQTLLSSKQLAAYVHFPQFETNGIAVEMVPDFDTVPPAVDGTATVGVGTVVERGRRTDVEYRLRTGALARHAFVTGVTGSGKTNTVFHLMKQAVAAGVPFLVLEPAKTEYRALLDDPSLGPSLRVFTLGNESVAPFRLNPFEVPDGIPVAVHIDLLRSVFSVSFGMWTPLPQVLEVCLHEVYVDRGWDVTAGTNRRLDARSDPAAAFPTLSDLVAKVDDVAGRLGYEERITSDIRAALTTRLNSLRTGGKGRMLDCRRSYPMAALLREPTVLELEGMGDDDDKAFVMALLMVRLVEHLRAAGDLAELRHLLVIEEAHRLLANPGGGARREEGESDVRGKAVETFTNLLSEIRAYGEGVVVVEQIPAKLAPDVVKNTNLKVAHRIVAGDDRSTLAAAMAMNERQQLSLARLGVGRAAVFVDGEDAPLLVDVPREKGGPGQTWPAADRVREQMLRLGVTADLPELSLAGPDCDDACAALPAACELARELSDDADVRRTVARIVLSALHDPMSLDRTTPELVLQVEARRPRWVDARDAHGRVALHAGMRTAQWLGALGGWTYAETGELGDAVHGALVAGLAGQGGAEAVERLRAAVRQGLGDGPGPYVGCAQIWAGEPVPCRCRYVVAGVVATREFDDAWREARAAETPEERASRTWGVCQDGAYHAVEFPDDAATGDDAAAATARRVALCFGQQMMASLPWSHPRTQARVLAELMRESGSA